MQIKVINKSSNPLPAYETKNSAGMDLRAFLTVHLHGNCRQRPVAELSFKHFERSVKNHGKVFTRASANHSQ